MMDPARAFDAEVLRRAPGHMLHPAGPADRGFLFELFSAVQVEHFGRYGASDHPALAEPLLRFQFDAQSRAYTVAYPQAMHRIVSLSGTSIGRMMIDWTLAGYTQGIDLSILPTYRSAGIGLTMLRAWLAVSEELALPARLHVMPDNPARLIYQRLGFREIAAEVPIRMIRIFR